MRVFVTGATGFIGRAIVQELLQGGHQVTGLARSAASAKALAEAGAEIHRGELEDLNSLRSGAAKAEGVIHAGFIHDFTRFKQACEVDSEAIRAMGEVLAGSSRRLVVTSGTAMVRPGQLATEDMLTPWTPAWPRASEAAAAALAALGVHTAVVRLAPVVHGRGDLHGFVPLLFKTAREKGFSAFIEEGAGRWNAVHRLDAARLFRLALEKDSRDACYHGAAEGAIPFKTIAEATGRRLRIPVRSIGAEAAEAHFGWFARMAALDCPVSSAATQKALNWAPSHASLLTDINNNIYTQPQS